MSHESAIDWNLCVICQKTSSEGLRYPLRNCSDVYSSFLSNVEELRELDSWPINVNYGNQGTVESFTHNKASWHKQCHQKFNSSMLHRVHLKRKRESTEGIDCTSRPKLISLPVHRAVCFFCEGDAKAEPLHEFTTLNVDKSVKVMAIKMNDADLLTKLADGDLIAIEAKYHLACLMKYCNQYHSHTRTDQCSSDVQTVEVQKAKAMAFARTVSFIENGLDDGTFIFKMSDMHRLCQEYLKHLGVDFNINKTCLKRELLEYFETSAVQEQSDGKKILLVFPEGMHEMFQCANLQSDYKSEALQISRIASDIGREMFAHEHFKFSGSFPRNYQSLSVPYDLKHLIAMILDGMSSNSSVNSQACLSIAQLIVYNSSKKKSKNSASDCKNVRHTLR